MTNAHNWSAYGSYTVKVLERYHVLGTVDERVERLKLDLETFAREYYGIDERWHLVEIDGSFSSDPAPDATIRLHFKHARSGESLWAYSTAQVFCAWLEGIE